MRVNKIEDGMDRTKVECTTYQMRNPFRRFADGVVTELDAHCYFQHLYAASLMRAGAAVLDVCCGRGLLIPFLRYGGHKPGVYVGVDIEPRNAIFADGRDPRRPSERKDWGFPIRYVEANVDAMRKPVRKVYAEDFHLVVFTSAIEHMQPDSQRKALVQCRSLAKRKATLYLTCPVSDRGKSGYDCHYAAHVYEPGEGELLGWLSDAGWAVHKKYGLCTTVTRLRAVLRGSELEGANYIMAVQPRAQALCTVAALYPHCATEMAFVAWAK